MNKEIIAEFSIGTEELIKEAQIVKKTLDELRAQNKEVAKTQGTSSEAFIKNSAEIKRLNTQYNTYVKTLGVATSSTGNLSTKEKVLNQELGRTNTSITEARESNKKLTSVRNELNLATDAGRKSLAEINAQIDSNNEFIKENVSQLEKQKTNVGNYKQDIIEALSPLGLFNKALEEGTSAGDALKVGLKNATNGMVGLTRSALSFVATPVGAVLATLVGALTLVKNAMNRSEESTNKITKIFTIFSGITDSLLKALEPLGVFIIDNLVVGFELAGKAVEGTLSAVSKGLAFLGFDDASKSVNNFNKEIKESVKASETMAIAEANLRKEQRKSEQVQLDFQKNAEKLRQIRDDESLTIAQRIKANEDLGILLKEQSAEELRIAGIALEVANLRIQKEGETTEALEAQAEARLKISEINERITGQESEQLTNINSLRKEAIDNAKQAQQEAIKEQETQLKLFTLVSEQEADTIQERKKLIDDVLAKELSIIDAKQKAGLSADESEIMRIEARNTALEQTTQLAIDSANKELEIYLLNNQHILDSEDVLSEQLLNKRKSFLDEKAQLQLEAIQAQGLQEDEYNAQRDAILRERDNAKRQEDLARDEQIREENNTLDQIRYEEDLAKLLERDASTLEYENLKREQDRELKLLEIEQNVKDETLKQLRLDNLKEQFAKEDRERQNILAEQQISLTAQTLGGIANLIGENTRVGKVFASAQALINTYQGVTAELATKAVTPFEIGLKIANVATVLGTGLSAVKKINSTKVKASKGISFQGTLQGSSHANGGIDLGNGVEAEGGENIYTDGSNSYIMNKQASNMVNNKGLLGTLSYINQKVGGGIPLTTPTTYAQSGGLVSSRLKQNARVNFPSDEQQTLRVINVAEDTAEIINESVRVENMSNL